MPPLTPPLVLTAIFGAIALIFLILGSVRRADRVLFFLAAILCACAGGAAWVNSFWAMLVLALLGLGTAFVAVDVIDPNWRVRAALCAGVTLIGMIALWPTVHAMSGGRVPCPAYVREHVNFRLVAGLDLRGGMRLVYTVDVEEAIKDKRDNYFEDMRLELTKVFGLHEGDERPKEEVYKKLAEKVTIESPRAPVDTIVLTVKPGADATKIDDRFLSRFREELSYARSQD